MNSQNEKNRKELLQQIEHIYEICNTARNKNLDPETAVEAIPAGDLASRVEGLVGPEGVATQIKKLGRTNITDIIDWLLKDATDTSTNEELVNIIDQAVRTSLAILTEGVVAAPLEGISKVEINKNQDNTQYLSIFFAGPIRSAGGTAQGLAVLVGEYIRRKLGLKEYRPTQDEISRYVEEIKLYHARCSRLQYFPSDEDIKVIVQKLGVSVDGDPTEKVEVAIHRNLTQVPSNRVRGGMCLVIAEGVAQKARKILGYSNSMGLDWNWLKDIGKKTVKADDKNSFEKAVFMKEVVGGRPIFSEPGAKGGFRLRYGRSRASGIAGKAIHPASMILLGRFPATGTQLKIEKPGKGCIVTECTEIEGPIVRLENGDVVRVESTEQALELESQLDEIIFIGDMLVTYGDFLQTNTKLLPAGYCEEWWKLEAQEKGLKNFETPTPEKAIKISKEKKFPLHPRYTYHWEDIDMLELKQLTAWILTGTIKDNLILSKDETSPITVLENIGVPFKNSETHITLSEYHPLLSQLGLEIKNNTISGGQLIQKAGDEDETFPLIEKISATLIRQKSGTYIGARMGRPEKARERKMKPPVHALFPIGNHGGVQRLVNKAAEEKNIEVNVSRYFCPVCKHESISPNCENCGKEALIVQHCPSCGKHTTEVKCKRCNIKTQYYKKTSINLSDLWKEAMETAGNYTDVKGINNMISKYKVPEPLIKGLLRALNDVFVFKDGTIRHDSTDVPLTHFKPNEIHTSIKKIKKLGYKYDVDGKEITSDDQVIELMVQDIVLPRTAMDYLFRVANFLDQLLEKFYKMDAFYKLKEPNDLVGHLLVGLAPHTSAGVTGRIIGYNEAHVCFAHPFWHANKRRNADGDEDSVILLLDVLLNFSKMYLPAARGGKMDAPLVVTTLLDPKEVDDEAHKIEVVKNFNLDFYEKTWKDVWPDQVEVKIAGDLLDDNPYSDLHCTHGTKDITGPVIETTYVLAGSMVDKVDLQLGLAEKIRAVDEWGVADVLINSHFLRDTYGNLRAFTRQHFRCVKCNESYRRTPLKNKCTKCGGKIILTVSKGNITKYLGTSIMLCEKYGLSNYLKQRLNLLEREVESLFENELDRQVSISDFM